MKNRTDRFSALGATAAFRIIACCCSGYIITSWAVFGTATPAAAARRGAGLGFVAYATYELTNWAVLRDWPAWIIPIDIAWGLALTAVSALAGKLAQRAFEARPAGREAQR